MSLAFIVITAIGTVTHELGHYYAAKFYNLKVYIDYGATYWDNPLNLNYNEGIIILAGPLETITTGSIGFLLLLLFNKVVSNKKVVFWGLIFMSLFWLRQVANFTMWIAYYLLKGQFTTENDEVQLDSYFGLPVGTILSVTAFIGLLISLIVIFKYIPNNLRITFILSGILGGILGFINWFYLLGPLLMP